METEKKIIYSILNTIRAAEYNLDEPVTERLLRAYLSNYRADALRKHYENGINVSDEVFQTIIISLEEKTNNFNETDAMKASESSQGGKVFMAFFCFKWR